MSEKVLPVNLLIIITVFLTGSCANDRVTLHSLLNEMTHRENLTYLPVHPYKLHQFSSYNRESVLPDKPGWFANSDMSHFIRVEQNAGRREFVMLDTDGPGVIVRWWMTFYRAQNGLLRVYIDNNTLPVLSGTPKELLRGELIAGPPLAVAVQEGAPLGEAGRDYDHNFYVPLPFSKHCKITYQCDSLVMKYENEGIRVPQGYWWPDVFYNIGCRIYKKNVDVESISKPELLSARPRIDVAGIRLFSYPSDLNQLKETSKVIPPGDSAGIEFAGKDHAVNFLTCKIMAKHIPQSLRSTAIKADFDGINTILVPVGEFFGTGYIQKPHQTWMNRVDSAGKMESYWVMPFRERCTIRIINYGSDTIETNFSASLTPYSWTTGSMYFGSSWHEYYGIRTRDTAGSPYDLNFIDISGKGMYVGDQITLFNNTYQWWGEGDEKIFVDGEAFPSSFGTGSEDYYGYSFGRQEPFSHPFLSQPVGTGNMSWGPTVNMRHRSLDAIPFESSISSNIELWHWADIRMNYALTTYYYIIPSAKVNIVPDIMSFRHPVVLTKEDFNTYEK